jgi:hypothetical protein
MRMHEKGLSYLLKLIEVPTIVTPKKMNLNITKYKTIIINSSFSELSTILQIRVHFVID